MTPTPNPNLFHLALAREEDRAAIDGLRIDAYAGATYFQLKDTRHLQVAEDPQGSCVLCAWDGDVLAATVRLAPAQDEAQAADLLGFALPRAVALPAVVFSRGAVNPTYRGQGWMPFLLTLGVRLSQRLGMGSALGAQASGTPHQGAMLRAGWEVHDVGRMSHEALDMKSTAQFLWLERERFEAAVRHGMEKAQQLLARCAAPSLLALSAQVQARARHEAWATAAPQPSQGHEPAEMPQP